MDQKNIEKVNIKEEFRKIEELWKSFPQGEINGIEINFVKIKGKFKWHYHEDEDELFWVLKGGLSIQLRDKAFFLNEGEFVIVPKKVKHIISAEEETQIVSIKQKDAGIIFSNVKKA